MEELKKRAEKKGDRRTRLLDMPIFVIGEVEQV